MRYPADPVMDTHQALLKDYEVRALHLGFSDVKVVDEDLGLFVRGRVLGCDDLSIIRYFSDPQGKVTLVATSLVEDVVVLIDEIEDGAAVAMAANSLGELVALSVLLGWPTEIDNADDGRSL
jgi:hypothetical protein